MGKPKFNAVAALLLLLTAGTILSGNAQPVQAQTADVSGQAHELLLQGFDDLSRHDPARAETAFRQSIEIQPEAEPAHRGLGIALRDDGRLEEAFRELRTATQLDPNDSDAHYTLGSVAWTLSVSVAQSGKRTNGLSSSDYQALAGGEFAKALELSPRDPLLRMNLAVLYLDANRRQDAIQQAEEAVRIAPDQAGPHIILGRCYASSGEDEKAAKEYESAAKIDPQNGEALIELGELRLAQHRNPQAEEYLRQAIQVSPKSARAHSELAKVLLTEGKNGEARELLEKSVALDPQDWQGQYELATLLNQAGETARATQLLNQVLKVNPDFAGAREQLAVGLLRRGDLQGASNVASDIVAKNPQAPEGHRIMALVLWKQRDYEGALAECAIALNLDQNSSSMMAVQSIALWESGRKKEAQATYREAAKLEPQVGSSDVFCRLVLCDAHDIIIVSDFLHKNRWVLMPAPQD